jgi:hypothetical protein
MASEPRISISSTRRQTERDRGEGEIQRYTEEERVVITIRDINMMSWGISE